MHYIRKSCVAIMLGACPIATIEHLLAQEFAANSALPIQDLETKRAYEHAAMTNEGDPTRGQRLFQDDKRGKCIVCHRIQAEGGLVGPELTFIGGKFDRPHLIESLLEPSQQIVEGFRSSTILTSEGQILTGVVKSRSMEKIRLLDSSNNAIDIDVQQIVEEKFSDVSIMPTGLPSQYSLAEFTDLIAYLESLRSDSKDARKMGASISGPVKLPKGFKIQTIATGLSGAVALEVAPDGRVFVCEQTGALRVVRDGRLLPKPFVTVPVQAEWERGLIGVTVDPDFTHNPYVYVCYVAKEPFVHHVISRFLADGDVAKPGSEQVLLEGDDQAKLGGKVPAGHQGGALHFGLDGCLYISIGEQTAELPAQSLETLQGKLLRIRADGSIPNDNPFIDKTTGKYQSIWAYGLRNPFTFAVQRETGDILMNDVGGVQEEINRGIAGANYGWPVIDHGPTEDDRFVGPIHVYPQASISGGDFVPSNSGWPVSYRGKYLFADFVRGWIHMLDPQTADAVRANSAQVFAEGLRRPVDIRFGPQGELYVLLRNAWVIDGKFEGGTSSLLAISRDE